MRIITQKKEHKGFTLIEILIVVAIIAILASVVLIGLGPAQQSGRDARRLSDLRETQNALELYYNAKGTYPNVTAAQGYMNSDAWGALSAALQAADIGITQPLPDDPTNNSTYYYGYEASPDLSSYVIGATLENKQNSVFTGYNAPSLNMTLGGGDCQTAKDGVYCLSL
jgi:prepilin-type N-terminal cleavage/methylation domain-containing protein